MKRHKTVFFLFIACLLVTFGGASSPANAQCVPAVEGPFGNASCGDWIDNDCDGLTDTADTDCYNYVGDPDTDDDGDGMTENELDCNDDDATVHTGATRICDAKDNNCDGRLDFSADVDNDNDGYAKCVDCADGDPNINPGVVEGGVGSAVCTDGIDNDCDFLIDLAEPGCQDPCIDGDGDGYYSIADSFPACTFPLDDCDDSNAAINPGALDDTCNNIDENCAGGPDDGYIPTPTNCGIGACASSGLLECQSGVLVDTCLENAPGTEGPAGPPADPTCSDLIDNDCDGLTDGADDDCIPCVPTGLPDDNCDGIDDDCDGTPDDDYVSPPVLPCGIGECVATAPCQCTNGIEDCPVCVPDPPGSEGPIGDPTCIDGLDNDCDGTTDGGDNNCQSSCLDNDGDGYGNPGDTSCTSGSALTDCDDTDDQVYPGATRICDGKDSNCDGRLDFAADVDVDGDTYPACAECNDNDPAINPGATEGPFGDPSCFDGVDNDCDGYFDIGESACQSPCIDEDEDGYYSTASLPACTFPHDDCDDSNAAINPGALDDNCNDIDEDCSLVADDGYIPTPTNCGAGVCASTGVLNCLAGGILDNTCTAGAPTEVPEVSCSDTDDNDCDGLTDGADPDCSLFCVDVDGDGYGVVDHPDCTNAGDDCDDSNAAINPGASDSDCNNIDENCAGGADDGYVPDAGCGVGDCLINNTPSSCAGGVETACQPGAPGIEGPMNDPTCSGGADEDCDGLTDGVDPNCQTSCVDNDGDGYGNPGDPTCTSGSAADCDDTDPLVYPGATRICDGKDSNCDGRLDFAADVDVDGDSYPACAECNDNNPAINPGATEGPPGDPTCFDGVDNDCDGWFDSGQAACNDPCVDADGDGFYDVNSDPTCLQPRDDCDDSNANIYPGAPDAVCDGVDNNCDLIPDDAYVAPVTNCGLGICATTGLDECINGVVTDSCAPLPAAVPEGPFGDPTCTDSLDNDCDGLTDSNDFDCDPCVTTGLPDDNCDGIDDDCINGPDDLYVAPVTNCGFGECATTGLDECIAGVVTDSCVPLPAGSEGPPGDPTCSGGLDEDCDGLVDLNDPHCGAPCPDDDLDGYIVCDGVCDELGRACGDCDDTDPLVYPGATRICDGKDNNCDGRLDFGSDVDSDADGYPVCAGDCNDSNPNVNPGVTEGPPADATCSDGLDNDCDGFSDVGDNNGIPNCLSWDGNCTTRTEPKNGPHMFDLMDPGPTGSTSDDIFIRTSCQWCHTDATGTIDQQLDCQRCHADWNDPSDPLNGVLKDPSNPIAYPLDPPYGFATAPDVKTHLHDSVSPVTAPHCITCHNPHLQEQDALYGTTYGKMIKEFICYDETRLSNRYEDAIEFTSNTGAGSFADGPLHNENICEMCHTPTLTNHHANDGSAPADNPGGTYAGHHDGEDCMQCHAHSDGFNASSCSDCHSIPQDAAGVGPAGGRRAVAAEFPVNDAHAHYGADIDGGCVVCHSLATHQNGYVELIDPDDGSLYTFMLPVDLATDPDLSNFCANCHDADGAQRLASPLDPFGNGNAPPDVATRFLGTLQWDEWYGDFCFGNEGTLRRVNSHHDISDADQIASGAKIECLNCHGAHNASADTPIADPSDQSQVWTGQVNDFCLSCHYGGSGPLDPNFPLQPIATDIIGPAIALRGLDTGTCSYNEDPWWIDYTWTYSHHGLDSKRGWDGYSGAPSAVLDCTECHDPHGSYSATNTPGNPYMIKDFIDGSQLVDDGVRPGAQWTGPPWDDADSQGTSGEVVVTVNGIDVDWGSPGSLCSKCHSNWLAANGNHDFCTGCQTCHGHGQSFGGTDWGPEPEDSTSCFEIVP